MQVPVYTYDAIASQFDWRDAVAALEDGHKLPRPEISDAFLGPKDATLLSRGAYIPGLGYGVKSVTVCSENAAAGLPTVQGAMLVFEPAHGQLRAIIESRLITEIKTAADSVLGARLLARPDSRHLLVVGAGTVARSLVSAYRAIFPDLDRISIWARRTKAAEALAAEFAASPVPVMAVADLPDTAAQADIISCATMARDPILRGDWLSPGTHVDLIGAFKADMREADDMVLQEGRIFVDSRETTIAHIGELMIPIASGAITPEDVLGDLYQLVAGTVPSRIGPDDITVFKNGGGAHLDLMIANYLTTQNWA